MDDEDPISHHASGSGPGSDELPYDDPRRIIYDALKDHGERRVRCKIQDKYENVVLAFFKKAHDDTQIRCELLS